MNPQQATLLISAGLLLGGGYLANESITTITKGFTQRGWNRALHIDNKADISTFAIKCLIDTKCRTAYTNVLNRRNAYWYAGAALLGFVGTLGALHAIRKMPKVDPNYKPPGASRWADRSEIELYITGSGSDKDPQRGYLGILRDGTVLAPPETLRNAHAVVIGGPGAAKSTGYHKPNMILDALQGTVSVVLDLKFPDPMAGFFDMVPLFYEAGRPVQVYAPFTTSTMRLNLLQNATTIEGAYDIASMIIPVREDEGGSAFYKNIERTLLSAMLLGVANTEKPSMQEAFKICLRGAASIKDFISGHNDFVVRDTAAAMLELDNKTVTGIAASLTNSLQIFNHPAVSRATTPEPGENLDLDAFWWEPGLLYIGLEQAEVVGPRGKILIQLLKRFVDKAMLRAANMRTNPYTGEAKPEGKMPHHVGFYLDEFPAMGVLPDIANNFAMMRSYRVSYHVTLQNLSQGEVLYGRDGFRSFFNNNLQHILFFPSRTKMDDAKYFSDYLGDITVTERRWSDSEQKTMFGGGGSKGESWGDAMRKMLSPGEMLSYPNNEAVLFVIGAPAIQVVMPGYYQEKYHLLVKDPKTGLSNKKGKQFVNPIYKLYSELNKHDPRKFLEQVLMGMDQDKISEAEHTLSEEESFQVWADSVATYGAHVVIYEDRDKYVIHTEGLPTSLSDPDMLSVWEGRNWVKHKDSQLDIKKDGLRVLGIVLQRKLMALRHRGPVLMWLNQNAALLEDHPARLNASGELPAPTGYYREEKIIIGTEDAKQIWKGVLPPDKYATRKNTVTMYEIPLDDDDFLIEMQSLIRKNKEQSAPTQPADSGKANEASNNPSPSQGAKPTAKPGGQPTSSAVPAAQKTTALPSSPPSADAVTPPGGASTTSSLKSWLGTPK